MILQQYRAFILLTFICFQNITAQKVTVINIDGNESIEQEVYINSISKNLSKSPDEIKLNIIRELTSRGYYNPIISKLTADTTSSKDSIIVDLSIIEGEQSRIRNITVDSVNVSDSIMIHSQFNFLVGEVFLESEVEQKIDELLVNYENSGYPFVRVIISSVNFINDEDGNHFVDLFLKLEKDKLRKIDKVEIKGNKKTNDKVIINNAHLIKGEPYSQERLEQIPVLLRKLNFFKSISKPTYYINSKDEGILQLEVEEKNTNSFDGILGYVPSTTEDESGYFTGFVNIGLRNLFGTGRGLSIKWHQENSLSQEMELKYLEPWLFDQPFNLHLQFFQRKQDSSYVKRILGGDIEFLATENISASFILESESIIPSINVSSAVFPKSVSLNTGLELKLDYRDDIYSPKSGSYFATRYKYRSKSIDNFENSENLSSTNVNFNHYELDFGFFYQVFQSQVIALGLHAKAIDGDNFDLTDLFQFGGTNTLRGFRENQFIGNKIFWSNLEYRFLLSESSYLFTFFDAGYYLIDENISQNIIKQSAYKNGYGLGISLDTALGIMRVSYAFAEGGSISNGLIHFGILNDF